MSRINWNSVVKSTKVIKKNVKTLTYAGEFLREFPKEGEMRDNISKNIIIIKDAKSSSLRRYVRLLDNLYFMVSAERDRNMILQKKIEIESELNSRADGIVGEKDESIKRKSRRSKKNSK